GLDQDGYALRLLADQCPELVLAASCSKNFGLYRERVGLAAILAKTPQAAQLCTGQLSLTMRKMISMPPDHGAALVAKILSDETLKSNWMDELETMRVRMVGLRNGLADALREQGSANSNGQMANALAGQKGMFSLLPLTPEQAQKIRSDHAVYLLNSGRINIAGARTETLERLASCILDVL
ncbi:MAG TPA: aminotransferase class I/II-fold pyridoxal phosphate-dependent enzyme, partial [Hellea balneolensis]|nr:aminotransferase class I/II-fold pyridoxal phosphate-dependent enzyme [Hellea balneolensis]